MCLFCMSVAVTITAAMVFNLLLLFYDAVRAVCIAISKLWQGDLRDLR